MMTRSFRIVSVAVLLAATSAGAQELAQYNRALGAYNAGEYTTSAQIFFELAENSTDAETRQKSEYYLAQSFLRAGLPFAAASYHSSIVDAGKDHPFYLKAVEGLVDVQALVNDQNLIPNKLNNSFDAEAWAKLPLEVQSRINLMIASISRRKAQFEEARDFLSAIDKKSAVYAQARYLTGVILSDPRFPGREDEAGARKLDEEAIAAFKEVQAIQDPRQVDLQNVKQLATLGLGRLFYGLGEFQQSVKAYEQISLGNRFSRYWDVALFENGFARFQNDDFGGALGSLQALYAPQFEGTFQPESRILTATVYYFSCLYDESKRALDDYDRIYKPMREALLPLIEDQDQDPTAFYELIAKDDPRIPRPVYRWVRNNERLGDTFANLQQIEREKAQVAANQTWAGGALVTTVQTYLDQNLNVLQQVAGALARERLNEAARNIKAYEDQSNIIRFEISNAERELAEAGLDQQALLASKSIFRPQMPAADWNYWRFQGEFWRDEIGYYQYTLKNGCSASSEE